MEKRWLIVSLVVVSLFAVGWLFFNFTSTSNLSNADLAERSINLIDKMSANDDGKGYYGVMNCDGTKKGTIGISTRIWALLAKASIYDLTQDEKLIKEIRELENQIYLDIESRVIYDDPHRELVTMVHPLLRAFNMLKGKNVLADESRLKKDVREIVLNYVDYDWIKEISNRTKYAYVQDTAMMSVAFYDSIPLFKENGEDQSKINKILTVGEQIGKRAFEIAQTNNGHKFGVQCWLIWSDYNYDKALGKDTSAYEATLLSNSFLDKVENNELMTANSLHPCMEVMLDLYQERRNEALLSKFNEYNSLYLDDTIQTDSSCSRDTKFAIRNKYGDGSGDFFLSDNAYQIYLITRPEVKMVVPK